MKKAVSILMVSALGLHAMSTAYADNVTIYGIVDTGVEYISHANATGGAVMRIPSNTGELPSRLGFKGEEALGGGYKAMFTLETGISVDTGSLGQGNRMFGRQAFVGIDGPAGAVTLGRQYSMLYRAIFDADLLGPNIYGIASLDSWIASARVDNAVAYQNRFGPVTVGALYSFGRDASPSGSNTPASGTCSGEVAGNSQACREWSAMLKYDVAGGGAAIGYDRQNGGSTDTAANFFNGVVPVSMIGSGNRDTRLMLDGYLRYGDLTVGAVWLNRKVESSVATMPGITSNQYVLQAAYRATTALTIDGLVQRIVNRDEDTRATMEAVRATYSLSKRTALYAQAAFLQNSTKAAYAVSGGGSSTPGKGMSQVATMLGVRHSF